jgi:hypothetical protein
MMLGQKHQSVFVKGYLLVTSDVSRRMKMEARQRNTRKHGWCLCLNTSNQIDC